jgi:hypothetical protein
MDGSDDEAASRRKSSEKSYASSDHSTTSTAAGVPTYPKTDHLPIPVSGKGQDPFLSPGSSGLGLSPYVATLIYV